MSAPAVDIQATGTNASVLSLTALTDLGREWIAENVASEPWQWLGETLTVDHRCGPDLLGAALEADLYVTLDGREPW